MIKGLLICLLLLALSSSPWLFGFFNSKSVDWSRSQYEIYSGTFTFQGKEYVSKGIDTMFGKGLILDTELARCNQFIRAWPFPWGVSLLSSRAPHRLNFQINCPDTSPITSILVKSMKIYSKTQDFPLLEINAPEVIKFEPIEYDEKTLFIALYKFEHKITNDIEENELIVKVEFCLLSESGETKQISYIKIVREFTEGSSIVPLIST